jgi:alpha-mannosidase
VISAIKLADDGSGLIIRLWNPSDKQVETKIKCLVPLASAHRCTMNEEIVENLSISDNIAAFTVGPYKIETCLLKINV